MNAMIESLEVNCKMAVIRVVYLPSDPSPSFYLYSDSRQSSTTQEQSISADGTTSQITETTTTTLH